jgi:hypothetical protein
MHRRPSGKAAQTIGIRRRRPLIDDFALDRHQADIDLSATQIQSSVQHEQRASLDSLFGDTLSLPPRRPSFIAVRSGSAADVGHGCCVCIIAIATIVGRGPIGSSPPPETSGSAIGSSPTR